jgi:hypothetical protein
VYLGKTMSDAERHRLIRSVTIPDVQKLARRVFQPQTCHISYTGSRRYL